MNSNVFRVVTASLFVAALAACGGGGSSGTPTGPPTSTTLTLTGTAATGLAIPGAIVTSKCKVGTGTATTLNDGSYAFTIADGQLPCLLQITLPVDGTKLHTVVTGDGSTATANITPLTEMVTARVLGREPNVFFAAFDSAIATQKVSSTSVQAAQTDIRLILTGIIDITSLGNFITAPLKAATQDSPTTGDAHDKLLDALKLKFSSAQIGTLVTALVSNQTTDAIRLIIVSMTTAPITPPTASAGAAQSVVTGTTVTLDASTSSAADGKSLTYAWTLTSKPAGSAAALAAPATAKPTFVADMAGSYVASVIVNDGTTASSAAAVTVNASTANATPVANAGVAQNVVAGGVVTLDGSTSSDANSDPLTYAWTLTSRPAGSAAALSSTTSTKPTFTADLAGAYVASLTVNDGNVNSNTSTVSVTASAVNAAPVANAGVAQNVVAGSLVTLDGSASTDANGDSLSYAWTLTSRPDGSVAMLCCDASGSPANPYQPFGWDSPAPLNFGKANTVKPKFSVDIAGTYVASLIVNDGKVNSTAATVAITVPVDPNAPTSPTGLAVTTKTSNSVTLTWNASTGGAGGVYSYQIYRNGYAISGMGYNASTALTYTDGNLTPGMAHSYSIAATSVSGAKSLSSTAASVTTLELSLLKNKLTPFIVFESATGKIMGQAFASPGVIAASAALPGYSVVAHAAIDTATYGIKSIGVGQYAIYLYSTGAVVEQPLTEMVLNGTSTGNASFVTIDLISGHIRSQGSSQASTLLLNISGNANGGGGYLDKEIL